jgi:hypothetical protein
MKNSDMMRWLAVIMICGQFFVTPAHGEEGRRSERCDFFHIVSVPDQVTTESSLELQVIAENVDPALTFGHPVVADSRGRVLAMDLRQLKWPGTKDGSVSVHAVKLPLDISGSHVFKVHCGTKQLEYSIQKKDRLTTRVSKDPEEFVSHLRSALKDSGIDKVEIDYDEPALNRLMHNIGAGITGSRNSWLTIHPAPGRHVFWNRQSGTPTVRPKADYLHLHGIVFGNDQSDGGGGQLYLEPGQSFWASKVKFVGKYKQDWPKSVPMTSEFLPDIRVHPKEGQRVFLTECSWDGTASIAATSRVQLGRDLTFRSHRGDYNNFGKVFLNAVAENAAPVRNKANTDSLHNDGFQIWGSARDIVFKGLKVVSPQVAASLQPFLLDRTHSPIYENILIDSIIIEGAERSTLKSQIAGVLIDSRVSNIVTPLQSLTLRQDFKEPNGAFAPHNAYFHQIDAAMVEHYAPGKGKMFKPANSGRWRDISDELSALPMLSGAHFSDVRVKTIP